MFFIGICKNCSSQRTKAYSSGSKRDNPLSVKVGSRSIKIWFNFFRSEYKILVALSDDKRAFFVCPVLPWHDLFLTFGIVIVGICAYPWHYVIYIHPTNSIIILVRINICPQHQPSYLEAPIPLPALIISSTNSSC